jgi:hypothetical protein
MVLAGWLIGFPLFIVAPGVFAAWLGSRLRRPGIAFVLAWIATPIATLVVTVLLWPVLRALTPPGNDGTGAIALPCVGVATGLVAGIAAAVVVHRRQAREGEATPPGEATRATKSGDPPPQSPR